MQNVRQKQDDLMPFMIQGSPVNTYSARGEGRKVLIS